MSSEVGPSVVRVSATWPGTVPDGRPFTEEFTEFSTHLVVTVSVMTPLSTLRHLDGVMPEGDHYRLKPAMTLRRVHGRSAQDSLSGSWRAMQGLITVGDLTAGSVSGGALLIGRIGRIRGRPCVVGRT